MSTTVSAPNSATFYLGAFQSLQVTSGGKGTLTFTSGAEEVKSSFVANVQNKTYGPFGAPMTVTAAMESGSCAYEVAITAAQSSGLSAELAALGVYGTTEVQRSYQQKFSLPVIERFNSIADWTVTNSGGAAISKADGVLGPNCINLTTPATAGQSTYVTQDQTIDLNTPNGLWLLMRNRYKASVGAGLTIYLANGAGMTVGAGGRFTTAVYPPAGSVSVQPHWVPKSGFSTLDGSPTFASSILSWRFRLDSVGTQARDIDLCGVALGKQRPTIIFTFDDGWDTSYSAGHAEARKREIPLIHYLIGSLLDRTDINYITTAQALEMAAAGDYLGLHGATRWDTNQSLMATDLAALRAKLGTSVSDFEHCAYPEGNIGDQELWQTTEATLASLDVVSGRLAGNAGEPTLRGYGDPYCLTAYPLNNTLSLVQAQAAVDLAESSGGTVIFYGHKISGSADALTWVTSDWTSLLNYVATKRDAGTLETKTIKQWYDQS